MYPSEIFRLAGPISDSRGKEGGGEFEIRPRVHLREH